MIFNFDDGPGGMSEDLLGYTTEDALLFGADGADWEAALLASGTLTTERSVLVDLALVAGGQPGALGVSGYGGVGGKGGGIALFTSIWLRRGVSYTVTVGASGQDTVLAGSDGSSYSASSGEGSDGGTPSSSRSTPPTPGADGVQIWGGSSLIEDLDGLKFGPGGGPGGYCSSSYAYYPGADGGDDGGGEGGSINAGGSTQAAAGSGNTGAGGGGAWRNDALGTAGTVGAGGSGIVRFRGHKEEVAA